jgi:putative ABC transport system ATP-binding protein
MITIANLTKTYNPNTDEPIHALKSLNLEVKEGECLVLMGVSGSGKSTLLSIIAALEKPTSGKLLVGGEAVAKLPDLHASAYRSRTIGFVFQHFGLLESLSVEENILAPLANTQFSRDEVTTKVQKAMQKASIEHKSKSLVRELSGGEKQRCAIARALVNEPQIIICDEPTANLDAANSQKLIDLLTQIHAEGKTILIATHDPLFQSLPFPSRIVKMEGGEIVL